MGTRMRCVGLSLAVTLLFCVLVVLYGGMQLSKAYSVVPHGITGSMESSNTKDVRSPHARFSPTTRDRDQDQHGGWWTPRKVLIFSYFRSGSSFTGDLIRHDPRVYYSFEPLQLTANKAEPEKGRLNKAILQAIYSCNYSSPETRYMDSKLLKSRHQGTGDLIPCFHMMNTRSSLQTVINECIKRAERSCQQYAFQAVKVVRMSMDEVGDLMTSYPDLAVIYLLRDVRASVWSDIKVVHIPGTVQELQPNVREMCQTLREDIKVFQQLFRQHPDRMRVMRYEDLAQDPLRVAKNIYDFLHLNFSDSIASEIQQQTSSDLNTSTNSTKSASVLDLLQKLPLFQNSRHPYSVTRNNSVLTAIHWQVDISASVLRTAQSECGDLLTLLGYRTFQRLSELEDITTTFKLAEQLPFRGDLNY